MNVSPQISKYKTTDMSPYFEMGELPEWGTENVSLILFSLLYPVVLK
jgi:hypothetical protein